MVLECYEIYYSCIPDCNEVNSQHNINEDPLFAYSYPEYGYYHLASDSDCIEAGDPGSDWFGEYWPCGGRINIGAYGGTRYASMSLSSFGILADLDNDFSVGFIDFGVLGDQWGCQSNAQGALNPPHFRAGANGPPWRGDLDRDGFVGIGDLVLFAEEWLGDGNVEY